MRYIFLIIIYFSIVTMHVVAQTRYRGASHKGTGSTISQDTHWIPRTTVLAKRGAVLSRKKQTEEDPQARKSRLNRETLSNDLVSPSSDRRPRPGLNYAPLARTQWATAAKVVTSGPLTSSWARTQDMQKLARTARNQRSDSIHHGQGSAAGGESYDIDGRIQTTVEGRRIESHVKVREGGKAVMHIDLGAERLKGVVGPKTEAHVKFRHPDPAKKLAMITDLKGKGSLASQGQGHFGLSDVSDHDVNL